MLRLTHMKRSTDVAYDAKAVTVADLNQNFNSTAAIRSLTWMPSVTPSLVKGNLPLTPFGIHRIKVSFDSRNLFLRSSAGLKV